MNKSGNAMRELRSQAKEVQKKPTRPIHNSLNNKSKQNSKSFNSKVFLRIATPLVVCILIAVTIIIITYGNNKPKSEVYADTYIGITSTKKSTYKAKSTVKPYEMTKHKVSLIFYNQPDITCLTEDKTLGELIEDLNIKLDDNELLEYDLSLKIDSDMTFNVDNVSYDTITLTESIDYDTEYVEVESIPFGTTSVYQSGIEGTKSFEYKVTYVNGVESSRELINEYISSYPTKQIVYKGIGGSIAIGGERYSYSYCINNCKSTVYTVYSGQGYTASGLPADESVIAVDPSVIPLGTRVYIEGIGIRIAADTGTAIKGNFIDIYFDVDNPLFAGYGVQYVNVYILN